MRIELLKGVLLGHPFLLWQEVYAFWAEVEACATLVVEDARRLCQGYLVARDYQRFYALVGRREDEAVLIAFAT